MRANLPPAPDKYDAGYFTRAFSALDRVIGLSLSKSEASASVLLLSPGGLVYKVTVADDGTLTTTSVPLGQSGATSF
jgi:hypothetical protein